MKTGRKPLGGKKLADAVVRSAQDMKAENITVIDLAGRNSVCDWFVVCEGDNIVHTRAIAGGIIADMKEKGLSPFHSEGEQDGRWVLIDFSDVIVHVMLPQMRSYYGLEELWNEAGRIRAVRAARK